MKKLLFSILLLGALGVFSTKAYADCQPIYGGGQNCTSSNFTIDKKVQVPGKGGGNYVDNLLFNDQRFSPSQTITYQLTITNTGNSTIPTLNITDNFPQYINFVSGAGSYDTNSKTLTFTISNLGVGQNQTINLQAQAADSKTVPVGVICDDRTTNKVTAIDNNGISNNDSSEVCIQNSTAVLPATTVKTTPATGPEMIPLALLFPGALGGFFLRKKSNHVNKKTIDNQIFA
jgi:uncharacterized repeat protein (TIGR01451 family)